MIFKFNIINAKLHFDEGQIQQEGNFRMDDVSSGQIKRSETESGIYSLKNKTGKSAVKVSCENKI